MNDEITYYYPADLNKPPMLFLWQLRDVFLLGVFFFISLIFLFAIGSIIPLAAMIVYGIMTLHLNGDISIYQYARKLTHFLVTQQQRFMWGCNK